MIKKHGKKIIVIGIIIVVIIVVVALVYIKLYPSTMQMTSAWWNYAPDAPVSDSYVFVSSLSLRLKVGSTVSFSGVTLLNTPSPCQATITQTQVAKDFQSSTFTVTDINKSNSYFKIIPTGGTAVSSIDTATYQCYFSGLITISWKK